MTTQNVTVSVPKDVLKRVKMLAAQRGTSISRLLDLGTQGRRRWSRDELHVR
jgi:Ribbon-helix-helix protein, copG family